MSDQPVDIVLPVPEGGGVIDILSGMFLMVQILAELQAHDRRLVALERADQARERARLKRAADASPRRPVGRPRGSKNKPKPNVDAAPPKVSWHLDLPA
jgi:hypothetical protein